MTNEITDKNKVVVTKLGDYWVSQKQAEALATHIDKDRDGSVVLEGNRILNKSIEGILTPEAYNIYNLKKRGGWQCRYQYWHERNQQCAHHLVGSQA